MVSTNTSDLPVPSVKVIVAFAVGIYIIKTLYIALASPLRRLPGPTYTLFSNLPLKLSVLTGKKIYFIDSLHRAHGPIVRISPKEVAVNSLEGFKQIHSIKSGYEKSRWYDAFAGQFDGLEKPTTFSMWNKHDHGVRRKMFARAFSKTSLRAEWEDIVRAKCTLAVARMGEESKRLGKVNVFKWWIFLSNDILGELAFGESFGNLDRGVKNEFIDVLETVGKGGGLKAELPLLQTVGSKIPTKGMQRLWNGRSLIREYATRAIDTTRSQAGMKNIFANAVAMADDDAETLSDDDIQAEAVNFIIAGSDTTGTTLTYLTWAVLQRPNVQTTLEQEVANLPADFSDADLEALPFLNAIIDETLRLYGAAPGSLPRMVPSGGAQLGDYFVPEGFTVSTQSYSLHRDPTLFSDPERYDPWRWLDTANPLSKEAKAAFHPFGAGSRTCIGVHLAHMELRIATALFFREWRGVARLAPETTPESMHMENFFLISPESNKCEVVIGKS
ncbi:cytochrome P450 [Venturia nashicola]|nr:cytochrome P450 [Venturia nashicola]